MPPLVYHWIRMSLLPWRGRTSKKDFLQRFQESGQRRFPEAQVVQSGELELYIGFPSGSATQSSS